MTPRKVGRALGDWMRRHRGERAATVDAEQRVAPREPFGSATPRAARFRQLYSVRVTPYMLRRGVPW